MCSPRDKLTVLALAGEALQNCKYYKRLKWAAEGYVPGALTWMQAIPRADKAKVDKECGTAVAIEVGRPNRDQAWCRKRSFG